MDIINEDVVDVVLEDRRLVHCWEEAAGEDVEETGFPASAVAEEDEFALYDCFAAAERHGEGVTRARMEDGGCVVLLR